eukprot:2343422-Rhodomonas_salina.2
MPSTNGLYRAATSPTRTTSRYCYLPMRAVLNARYVVCGQPISSRALLLRPPGMRYPASYACPGRPLCADLRRMVLPEPISSEGAAGTLLRCPYAVSGTGIRSPFAGYGMTIRGPYAVSITDLRSPTRCPALQYAVSGTTIRGVGYGYTRCRVRRYAVAIRGVRYGDTRYAVPRYAVCGTETRVCGAAATGSGAGLASATSSTTRASTSTLDSLSRGPTRYCAPSTVLTSGTSGTAVRGTGAASGTAVCGNNNSMVLRLRCAVSGTDLGFAATRLAVGT